MVKPCETSIPADPKIPRAVFDNHVDVFRGKSLLWRKKGGYPVFVASKTVIRSEPESPFPVLTDRLNDDSIGKRRLGGLMKAAVVEDAQSTVGTYPEPVIAILQDCCHVSPRETVSPAVVGELSCSKAAEPHVPRSDPHSAGVVLVDRIVIPVGEPLLLGVDLDGLLLQVIESVSLSAEPEVALPVLVRMSHWNGHTFAGR